MENSTSLSWIVSSKEECVRLHSNSTNAGDNWCWATWDHILCWPPTPPDTEALLPCPPLKGVDPTKYAHRRCTAEGKWEGRKGSPSGTETTGWSNYTLCFIPEIRKLMDQLYSNSEEDGQRKLFVAWSSRILETAGLIISSAAILLSLLIFMRFRSLKNNRTRIHWHLFVAMTIQLAIRLTLYIDQYVTRNRASAGLSPKGIDNTAFLCEGFYVLLEYAKTSMFLWMFIEGMYLHNMVTLSVFHDKPNYSVYFILGWGLPVFMTAVWAVVTAIKYTDTQCWFGYNLSPFFWILEGPRVTIIFTNLLFLLNILRVLITKLQASASSESRQVRKAVRAAIVLLPLLGITNSLQMIHSPLESSFVEFAFWTYFTTFLTAFQGFFVALIYCFLNNEVRLAIKKSWYNYNSRRVIEEHRRLSLASFNMYRQGHGGKRCSQLETICGEHRYSTTAGESNSYI